MNILYISADRGIPILGHKGAAVHIRSIVAAFDQLGHSVTIAAPRLGAGQAISAEILHLPLQPKSADLPPDHATEAQTRAYADHLFDRLQQLCEQQSFDLIFERYSLWSDVGARLAMVTGLPFILEVNAPLREEAMRYRTLFDEERAAQVERAQFAGANQIAVVSEPLRQYVLAHGGQSTTTHVLPNAVDPQTFHPAVRGGKVRERYQLHGKRVVGFVGRVRPWHDIGTLLAAIAKLRERDARFHLLLVGQTDERVAEQVAALGLTDAVTLTGAIPHAEIPTHIAAMDVAVSSHIASADSYFSPLKLYEYLAVGVPTVAAKVGQPSALIVHGENGLHYTAEDSADLATQITSIFADPADARRMAWAGAAQILQNHTWTANAAQMLKWIGAIVAQSETALPLLDDRLRQRLYRATRPDLARKLLKKYVDRWGDFRPKTITQIDILKYKPDRRCVLGYTLAGKYGTRRLIGKVFRDQRGAQLHAIQDALHTTQFGADATDRIRVPAALGYVPKMRMQVQAWAAGETLDELAAHGEIDHLMPRTARAIAKLHGWVVSAEIHHLLRRHPLSAERKLIDEFATKLAELRPLAPVELWRTSLQRWADDLPACPALRPVHRDFYYSQILFDGDDATLIDFDLLAWGDPAIDVANFTAHLTLLGLTERDDLHYYDGAINRFLTTYARHAEQSFWQRYQFYRAATFFRLLYVVSHRPEWAHHFDALVQQMTVSSAWERVACPQ